VGPTPFGLKSLRTQIREKSDNSKKRNPKSGKALISDFQLRPFKIYHHYLIIKNIIYNHPFGELGSGSIKMHPKNQSLAARGSRD